MCVVCVCVHTDVLAEETDQTMVEFAMGGVCNCCPDQKNKAYFIANDAIEFTIKCLSRCVCVCACAPEQLFFLFGEKKLFGLVALPFFLFRS